MAELQFKTFQLENNILSADSTGRAKLQDGFFSADSTGRAKFGNNFVTPALSDLTAAWNFTGTLQHNGSAVYSDAVETLAIKRIVRAATTGNLVATRVGNVLTADANGALGAIDGVTLSTGQRLLVKDQSSQSDNGIYTLTDAGSAGTPYVLTRALDWTSGQSMRLGTTVFVSLGTANGLSSWFLATSGSGSDHADVGSHQVTFSPGTELFTNNDNTTLENSSGTLRVKDLGISTGKLANNVLSADASGRGKLQDGFFNSATVTAKFDAASIALDRLAEAVIQADGGQAFTADQSMGGFKITNLADPSGPQDAATRAFVLAVAQGLDPKGSCRVATTANLVATRVSNTLTADANGALVVDGVTMAPGDRILVKNQTAGEDNGIYVVTDEGDGSNPFILDRADDADVSADVTAGLHTFVSEGSSNADTGWVLVTNDPITLNTTSLSFSQFSSASAFAGDLNSTALGYLTDTSGDLRIIGNASANVVLKLGDAAGARRVSFTDSTDTEVAAIDSDGHMSLLGDFTFTSGGTITTTSDGNITLDPNGSGEVTVADTLLRIGEGADVDIFLYAQNADANKPYLKYDAGDNSWNLSNDGSAEFTVLHTGSNNAITYALLASAVKERLGRFDKHETFTSTGQTNFDLARSDVDLVAGGALVFVQGQFQGPVGQYSISDGTGTAGVDELVFTYTVPTSARVDIFYRVEGDYTIGT